MPKPYSMDLRERAVSRVMAGESVRSVAAVVQVSVSSVVKWSQRHRATGSAAPGRMGGYRPRVLLPHRDWLAARIASGEHFTLRGLRPNWRNAGSRSTTGRSGVLSHAEGLSFKKKRAAKRAAPS
jgi:transposase